MTETEYILFLPRKQSFRVYLIQRPFMVNWAHFEVVKFYVKVHLHLLCDILEIVTPDKDMGLRPNIF